MHPSRSLGLLVLPLAVALPPFGETYRRMAAEGHHGKRMALKENAQFNFQPYVLTNLGMDCDRPASDDMFACQIRFDWHDPNSVRENNVSSCTCSSTWSWDGTTSTSGEKNTYPTQFVMCYQAPPTYFQMKFDSFDTAENFTLQLAHQYQDSENFTAPWIYPTTWANSELHLPVIQREANSLQLYDAGPVYAKIIGVSD